MPQPSEPLVPTGFLRLSAPQRVELTGEISALVSEHRSDTNEFLRNLIVQRRLYELKSRKKTWPWPGAANFIAPIIRFSVDHYKARVQRQFRQFPVMWQGTVVGRKELEDGLDWGEIAKDTATVAQYISEDPSHIDINSVIEDAIDAMAKDGTALLKVHYVNRTKRRGVRGPKGKIQVIDDPFEDHVRWDVIDIERAVWTIGGTNPDDMPLVGHWMELTRGQMRTLANEHKISKRAIEAVLKNPDDPWYIQEERLLDEEIGITRGSVQLQRSLNIYRIHELHMEWQLEPEDPPTLFTVWWHQLSNTILGIFDPEDFAKPYEVLRFIKRGRQFLASGMADPLRVLNLGANAVINQTTDAQTIANAFGYLYKADSPAAAFLANSGVFPGVAIPVEENVSTEFATFQLGAANTPVSLGLLDFYMQMAEMVAKIGPGQQGDIGQASRVSASVGLGLLSESNQMVDSIMDRLKDTLDRAMIRSLLLYANHNPGVFDEALDRDRATRLLSVIRDPSAAFPHRVAVKIRVASASSNKQKDQQDLIVIANFLGNIHNRFTEQAALATSAEAPPELKQFVGMLYKGMHHVVKQLIESFDQIRDGDRALPDELVEIMDRLSGNAPPQGIPGQEGGVFPRIGPQGGAEATALNAGAGVTGNTVRPAAGPQDLAAQLGGDER